MKRKWLNILGFKLTPSQEIPKKAEVVSVEDKGNNTFDVVYKTDAKPGESVSIDLSEYIEKPNFLH